MVMNTSIDLPDEVIEEIFSKCPVKSVVRFKSLSKSWQSIISDPRFSIRRLENQNNNKLLFLFLAPQKLLHTHIYLMRLERDGRYITESEFPYPSPILDLPICSCNGLFLLGGHENNPHFLLWNPSIGKHIIISGPRRESPRPRLSHFYYDSVTDDYKIVFVYEKCYTVYYCKERSWSEMKALPCDVSLIYRRGASVDGCFYGMDASNGEVVCFDTRDGNVHKFPQPNNVNDVFALTEESGRLYFHGYLKDGNEKIWAMEKHGRFENKWVMEKNRSLQKWSWGNWGWIINMEKEELANLWLLNDGYNIDVRANYKKVRDMRAEPRDDSLPLREIHWKYMSRIFSYSENVYMPCSNIVESRVFLGP